MRRGGSGEGGGSADRRGAKGSFRGNKPARGFDWDVKARTPRRFSKKKRGRLSNPSRKRARVGSGRGETHYIVSGGPMMVICHSKTLESSTRPAEKPSMGLRLSSGRAARRGGKGDGRQARREAGVGRGVGGGEVDRNARARGAGRGARSRLGERRARVAGSESRERARIRGRTFELLPQEEHGLVRHDGRDLGRRARRSRRAGERADPTGGRASRGTCARERRARVVPEERGIARAGGPGVEGGARALDN